MSGQPPIPAELWDQIPPAAQAALLTLLDALETRIANLEARLSQNSSNSSRPPSYDPPSHKRRPPLPDSGKKRGGQPGHRRSVRPLIPPERLAGSVACKPAACHDCGHQLDGSDPTPACHQVAEIPEIRPDVLEYRVHRLACPDCGTENRGSLPPGVPAEPSAPGSRPPSPCSPDRIA